MLYPPRRPLGAGWGHGLGLQTERPLLCTLGQKVNSDTVPAPYLFGGVRIQATYSCKKTWAGGVDTGFSTTSCLTHYMRTIITPARLYRLSCSMS